MKRSNLFAALRPAIITLLMIGGMVANAQSSWSTSKAVNEVANKDVFANEELAKTHITASSSMQPSAVSQKGVSKVMLNAEDESGLNKGNVASKGTPSMVVSKGVHQYSNRPRVSNDSRKDQGAQPLIPIDKKETFKE